MRFPFLSDKLCTSESRIESYRKNDSYNPDMAHSMMVSSTSENVNVTSGASHFVKTKECSQPLFGEQTSISNEQ